MSEDNRKGADASEPFRNIEVDNPFASWPGETDDAIGPAESTAFEDRTPADISADMDDPVGGDDLWDTPPPVLLDEPLRPVSETGDRLDAVLARQVPAAIPPLDQRSEPASAPLDSTDDPLMSPEEMLAFAEIEGRDPPTDAQTRLPHGDGEATNAQDRDSKQQPSAATADTAQADTLGPGDLHGATTDPGEAESATQAARLQLDPLPLDRLPEPGRTSWLSDFQLFQQETQRLARLGNWKRLAAVTGHALLQAPYATRGTRTSMLLDLALLYRDRLRDNPRAEQAFVLLSQQEPASAEALGFLSRVYEERGEWEAIYDLLTAAVQATWAPGDRLDWTREAAGIALERLDRIDLAIRAWEGLWKLGDAMEEASRALARLYRSAGRWQAMADFLHQQADRTEGAPQLVLLRELAEVALSGLRSPDAASEVLERIVELSPNDPIAALQLARVYAQRQDWTSLERLGLQAAAEGMDRDLQQLVADSLWQAERLDPAIAAYDRILSIDASYQEAIDRKREYLTRTERHAELLDLLVESADSADADEARAALLEQAAILAEEKVGNAREAISLWEAKNAIDPAGLHGYEALIRLYEQIADLEGVARTIGGQLALVNDRQSRIQLLRRLGDHCASRLGDDNRAEECWKEILSLDPTDLAAREDLIELHRRRGDFESLNSALLRQIWLTADKLRAENLCRMAAENLDTNFDDALRSIEAWRRVLDYAPADLQALQSLAKHYASLGERRQQIAVLEQQMRAVEEPALRIDLGMQIAQLWLDEGLPQAAAATYERVIRLAPTHPRARESLLEIYRAAKQAVRAFGLLDFVGTYLDVPGRIALLRRELELIAEDEHEQRFWRLRRILWLSPSDERGSTLDELRREATAAQLWNELVEVLAQLASTTDDQTTRLALLSEVARICEERLVERERAYVVLQSALVTSHQIEQLLPELGRLADQTKRYEDQLALLDCLTTSEFEPAQRKELMSRRAEVCERQLDAPRRAFAEHRRRLELDPTDWSPLADLQRLAETYGESHGLWRLLDLTYSELWDRTPNPDRRLELLRRRELIAREKLDDAAQGFELLTRRYRHDPADADLLDSLISDAEAQSSWNWLLPLLEATALNHDGEAFSADEVAAIAALYQDKLADPERAFVLESAVFCAAPDTDGVLARLQRLADQTKRYDQLAATLRLGAATATDLELQSTLLAKIAELYEDKVATPERAIDIHRRLLEIEPSNLRSLEVMVDWHRQNTQWRDLRDRLDQWLDIASAEANRVPKLIEIAFVSEQYLADPERALESYGRVLEIDPQHAEAKRGLESLLKALHEPALRKRWLQMQLRGADTSTAMQLKLEIARIQQQDLQDAQGAIETLQQVVAEDSAAGPGFEPLAQLLRSTGRHEDLVRLLQSRAEKLEDTLDQLAILDQALEICHEELHCSDGLREELYRSVLRLRPTDRGVRVRLARMLRNAERFADLAQLLDQAPQTGDTGDRAAEQYELARVYTHNLDQPAQAERVYRQLLHDDPEQEGALLALASAARARGDHDDYLALRRQQAKLLEPREGALVLCHLAEVCDETPEIADQMVALYREARGLDPDNVPAMEALKGIGRRLRSLRPAAALLPLDGEKELEPAERAARLRALGDNAMPSGMRVALDWYRRAVAIEPDEPRTWDSLARLLERLPNEEQAAFRARRGWAQALERSCPLSAGALAEEARRQHEVAASAKRAGRTIDYARLVQRAFDLVPSFAPAALATAEAQLELGAAESARHLLNEVLEHHRGELDSVQQVAALFCRGEALRQLDDVDGALRDFRDALSLDPLHSACLVSIGKLLAEGERPAAAMEHQVRALIALEQPQARAQQYYRLGLLLEDALGRYAEAGACYELALSEGMEERELLHRALRHYQRSGRLDESLDVVEGLLPTAEAPEELATLWLVRGEILAAREGCEDEAIEAFDMALSYDPGHAAARQGLVQVLEQRGDWNQVLQVLEASCDVGSDEQRSEAFRRMAAICQERLGDTERTEDYLRQAVNTYPTAAALRQLEQLYGTNEARSAERKNVLGLLVAYGPPWFSRMLELGKLLLVNNDLWAWCLLSPLLGVSQIEPSTKALLQGMRKEHERPPLRSPYRRAEAHDLLAHPQAQPEIREVLAELLEIVPDIGVRALENAGDGAAIAIGANTGLGRKFFAMGQLAGLPNCTLHRTQTLPESVMLVNELGGPRVVVRTDVMQQLVHAEVGFLFGYALELAQPGSLTMATMLPDERPHLLPALWHTLGFEDKPNRAVKALSKRIDDALDDERRARWTNLLRPLSQLNPADLGKRWWMAHCYMARRVGLLAGPDLRQAFRVIARIEEGISRPRVVARVEELDEYVAESPVLQDLVAFSASPTFGQLLQSAELVEVE